MIKSKYVIHTLIIIFIFLLDRFSKFYVIKFAESLDQLNIKVTSFLNIILVWNSGIGFGLFQFDRMIAYNAITLLIIIINFIIIYLLFNSDNKHKFFFSMILGGSFGNLYDRFYYSAVPDFIDLNYNGYHWFVFNVADIFISILQSGGMAVTGGVPALASGMVKTQIAYSELKKAGILSIGVACSKLSGGTYVMWNNHDILCVESPGSHDILFSGKRVTANLKSGEQLPEDFGQGSSLDALVDIIFSSRLEIKDGVTKIARVLLKKPKIKSIADSPSETIDESIEKTLSETSKAV